MIKPAEQNIRLADQPDGATQLLDVEELRERLTEAFHACGIQEAWVPDDLLDVLERRLRENGGIVANLLNRNEIYNILTESLNATGFADVAAAFMEEEAPEEDRTPVRKEWSPDELIDLLADAPWTPSDSGLRAHVSQATAEALARLAIPGGVSERLALEIARNLLAAETPSSVPSVSSAPSSHGLQQPTTHETEPFSGTGLLESHTQYIAADQWALSCSPQLQELLRLRILRPCPASDILPVAVVECNLARIFDLTQPPRGQDELVALLEALCTEVKSLWAQMHARMAACWPTQRTAGSRLLFNRYDAFLKLACPSHRRKEIAALKTRLAALWTAQLEGPSVSLCFIP